MKRLLFPRSFALLLPVLLLTSLMAGCSQNMEGGGPDVDFIREKTAKTPEEKEKEKDAPKGALLPLVTGSSWQMQCIRGDQQFMGEIKVVGPRTMDGVSGILVESRRKGKLFRQELYRKTPQGEVQLLALGENASNLLHFNPPVTLYKEGAAFGSDYNWQGTATLKNSTYPGTGYSRLTSKEKVKSFAGEFDAVRFESIITVTPAKQRVDFPLVQWMVPGTGIVQRRLADKGTAVTEILVRYKK